MGISDIHVFPITITCLLQGTLCDTGIPCTFYGENICSVHKYMYIYISGPKGTRAIEHWEYWS